MITLVPERRILFYVMAMAGGVILAAAWPDASVLTMLAAAAACLCSASPGCSGTTTCCVWAGANWSPVPHPVNISGSVR